MVAYTAALQPIYSTGTYNSGGAPMHGARNTATLLGALLPVALHLRPGSVPLPPSTRVVVGPQHSMALAHALCVT